MQGAEGGSGATRFIHLAHDCTAESTQTAPGPLSSCFALRFNRFQNGDGLGTLRAHCVFAARTTLKFAYLGTYAACSLKLSKLLGGVIRFPNVNRKIGIEEQNPR